MAQAVSNTLGSKDRNERVPALSTGEGQRQRFNSQLQHNPKTRRFYQFLAIDRPDLGEWVFYRALTRTTGKGHASVEELLDKEMRQRGRKVRKGLTQAQRHLLQARKHLLAAPAALAAADAPGSEAEVAALTALCEGMVATLQAKADDYEAKRKRAVAERLHEPSRVGYQRDFFMVEIECLLHRATGAPPTPAELVGILDCALFAYCREKFSSGTGLKKFERDLRTFKDSNRGLDQQIEQQTADLLAGKYTGRVHG